MLCDDHQINFFQDHTKVIVCPLMEAATYIDDRRESCTYRLSLLGELGCGRALWTRLRYAHAMVRQMLNAKSSAAGAGSRQDRHCLIDSEQHRGC